MNAANIILITFCIYLIYYFGLLIFLAIKNKTFTDNLIVSSLGASNSSEHTLFNISTILYGALSLISPYALLITYEKTIFILLGGIGLISTGFSTVFVGLLPMDTRKQAHTLTSILAFSGVALTAFAFTFIPWIYTDIPKALSYISPLILVIAFIMGIIRIRTKDLTKLAIFEWICTLGTVIWNLTLAYSLIAT